MSLGAFMGGFGKGMLIGKELKEAWEKDDFDDAAKEGADAQTLRRISPERAEKHEARNAKFRETDANAEFADRMNASDNFAEEMRDAGGVEKWVESNVDPNATPEQKQQAVDAYRKAYQTNTGPEMARTAAHPMTKLDPVKGMKLEEAWNTRVKNGLMSHVGNLVNTGQMDRLATDLTDLSGVPVTISPFEADGKKGFQIAAEGMEPMPFSGPHEAMTMVNIFAGRDPQAAAEAYEKLVRQKRSDKMEEDYNNVRIRAAEGLIQQRNAALRGGGVRGGGGSRGTAPPRGGSNPTGSALDQDDVVKSAKEFKSSVPDDYQGNVTRATTVFDRMWEQNPQLIQTRSGASSVREAALAIGEGRGEMDLKIDPRTDAINLVATVGPNTYVLEADVDPARAVKLIDDFQPQPEGKMPVDRKKAIEDSFMAIMDARKEDPQFQALMVNARKIMANPENMKVLKARAEAGDREAQRALRMTNFAKHQDEIAKKEADKAEKKRATEEASGRAEERERTGFSAAWEREDAEGVIPPKPPQYLFGDVLNPAYTEWMLRYGEKAGLNDGNQ